MACLRLDRLRPLRSWLLPGAMICAALYLIYLRWIAVDLSATTPATAPWGIALLQACLASWGTLVCVVAALRWLDRPSPLFRYLAASAY